MVDTFAAHKLHHMYIDKQLQIWGGIHTPHLRDCRVSKSCHQATKQWFVLTFWLLKSVGIFFENSNGKWTNNPLFGWQPVHWLSESQCTHRVNTLFTHGVEAPFTQVVNTLFTRVVEALFTRVVKALFTQAVHAFRGKMTMKMPWNKPWFSAVFQNRIKIGEKIAKIGHLVKAGCQQNKGFSCYM